MPRLKQLVYFIATSPSAQMYLKLVKNNNNTQNLGDLYNYSRQCKLE